MITSILNDKVTRRVLLLISYSKGRGYYFNELKEALSINNSSLYKILNKLLFHKIILKQGKVIKLNFENPQTNLLMEIIEKDKLKLPNFDQKTTEILIEFISEIQEFSSIKNVFLFGSYAKRTNKKNSDIDVAIICDEKLDLDLITYKLEEKYNIKIELHFFTEKDFKVNTPIIKEIKRDKITLV